MAGYTRQSTFADGDTITAALFNNEYNQLLNAFGNTGGHKHDGTANEGPVIGLIGDAGVVTPLNKVLIDSTNDHIEFWIDVSSSSVQQLYIADGAIVPVTDNDIDLGTSSLQFKDLYINGTANIDSLVLATGSTVTAVLDEDDLSSDSATSLVTQQSVKAYIDAQVTAQDLDFLGDSGGALSIDLDSESLTIAGGTGLDTVGSGNTVTVNIDATVATLTGSQTLTNKTIDVDNNTVSNIEVDNFKASAIVLESEGIGSNDNDTSLPTSAAVKAYVDTQITAEDLDITTDSGTIAIDLDSETLTVSGGTGLDSSATGNAVTLAIDSTVTTLTGTQTLTNKTLTSPDVNTPDIDGGTIDGATIATSDVTVGAGKTLDVSAGTLTLADNQISGDKVEGGTIAATTITDLTFGSLNDGTITATAFVDEDNMASNSATLIPTQQSVKAYVDTTVAATNEVVEDTTPQLGGDLDLNSSDITGTGNINITGTIQSSGNITGTLATAAQPNITSVGTLTGLTTTGDINFGDDDKAVFGAGSDLEIYHDSSNGSSVITEAGGGDLLIKGANLRLQSPTGENYFVAINNSSSYVYYDNAAKIATTATGIDVTGTATMDGLTVDVGDYLMLDGGSAGEVIHTPVAGTVAIESRGSVDIYGDSNNNGTATSGIFTVYRDSTYAGGTAKTTLNVTDNGDISFYDDTGTSQALFWDASAESLGIGTTSPSSELTVQGVLSIRNATQNFNGGLAAEVNTGILNFGLNEGSGNRFGGSYTQANQGGMLNFDTRAGEPLFQIYGRAAGTANASGTAFFNLLSDGNVGIGTTSPSAGLQVAKGSSTIPAAGASTSSACFGNDNSDDNYGVVVGANSNGVGYISSQRTDGTATTYNLSIQPNGGNVGIGTSSPNANHKLTIVDVTGNGGGTLGLNVSSSGTSDNLGRLHFGNATDPVLAAIFGIADGAADAGAITFRTEKTGEALEERMRIDSSGNVGIGTSSPSSKLNVVDNSTADSKVLRLSNGYTTDAANDAAGIMFGLYRSYASSVTDSGFIKSVKEQAWDASSDRDAALTFGTRDGASEPAERMRIDSSGNVLVGKTSTGDYVTGIEMQPAGAILAYRSAVAGIFGRTNAGETVRFTNNGAIVGSISTTGAATAYNTSSDARLKDVTGSARGLEVINELNPVSYNWKADGQADEGLIAQEVLDIVPNAVSGSEEDMYQMDYSKLVVHLVAGMKEQQTQIDALQSEINLLKGE